MSLRLPCLAVLLGLVAVTVPAAEPAKGQFDSLVKNSPFGSAATTRSPGAESSQVEFRGMFVDQGEQFFSFYEAGSNTSQWVGLKETGTPFTVQGYDSATQTVKVLYRNQPVTLSLKKAQIVVQAMPPPPPVNSVQSGPTPTPGGGPVVKASATPSEEAARLAQVAEEIRRRRALRSQPTGGPPMPQPVPANSRSTLPLPNRP